jgi:hypothetical protein
MGWTRLNKTAKYGLSPAGLGTKKYYAEKVQQKCTREAHKTSENKIWS